MSNNTLPPQVKIPGIGLRAYIADLAARHGVTHLPGDYAKHDETKRLVLALHRANVIDRKTMVALLRRYFEEQKREQLYAAIEQGTPLNDGLPFLKARQRKDAEEVKAGLRSARSLVMFPEGWLKGATFTANPESEFNRPGEGW